MIIELKQHETTIINLALDLLKTELAERRKNEPEAVSVINNIITMLELKLNSVEQTN